MEKCRYDLTIWCECGNELNVTSEWILYPDPQIYQCSKCKTRYILKIEEKGSQ